MLSLLSSPGCSNLQMKPVRPGKWQASPKATRLLVVELKWEPDSRVPVHSLCLPRYHALSSLQEELFCDNSFLKINLPRSNRIIVKWRNCKHCGRGDFPGNFLGLTVAYERRTCISSLAGAAAFVQNPSSFRVSFWKENCAFNSIHLWSSLKFRSSAGLITRFFS